MPELLRNSMKQKKGVGEVASKGLSNQEKIAAVEWAARAADMTYGRFLAVAEWELEDIYAEYAVALAGARAAAKLRGGAVLVPATRLAVHLREQMNELGRTVTEGSEGARRRQSRRSDTEERGSGELPPVMVKNRMDRKSKRNRG